MPLPICTPLHLIALHCKLGEIFLLKTLKHKKIPKVESNFRDFFVYFCRILCRYLWALAFVSVHLRALVTSRCKRWKILSINWLNIARTNIEPKNSVQLIENGITHYYIAYCILYLHLFHQNSFFSLFL